MQMTEAEYRARNLGQSWPGLHSRATLYPFLLLSLLVLLLLFASLFPPSSSLHVEYSIAHRSPPPISCSSPFRRPSVSPKFKRAPSPGPLSPSTRLKAIPFSPSFPVLHFKCRILGEFSTSPGRSTSPMFRAG